MLWLIGVLHNYIVNNNICKVVHFCKLILINQVPFLLKPWSPAIIDILSCWGRRLLLALIHIFLLSFSKITHILKEARELLILIVIKKMCIL